MVKDEINLFTTSSFFFFSPPRSSCFTTDVETLPGFSGYRTSAGPGISPGMPIFGDRIEMSILSILCADEGVAWVSMHWDVGAGQGAALQSIVGLLFPNFAV